MSIVAVTGANGAGKTAWAVRELRFRISRGYTVYANFPIKGAKLVTSWAHLIEIENAYVLLDEIVAVASSRDYSAMPTDAVLAMQTLRHRDVGLYWTAPNFGRADKIIREVTQRWVNLSPLISWPERGKIWPNTRLSLVSKGIPVTDGSDGQRLAHATYSLFRPKTVSNDYDTLASIEGFSADPFPSRCRDCGARINYGSHARGDCSHRHIVRDDLPPVPESVVENPFTRN